MVSYTPIYSRDNDVYNLEGFSPQVVDYSYLKGLGVEVEPDEATLEALKRGSLILKKRLERIQPILKKKHPKLGSILTKMQSIL